MSVIEFRYKLVKMIQYIFDNEKEFIQLFLIEKLKKNLKVTGVVFKNIGNVKLENVMFSDSQTFIRILYFVNISDIDADKYTCMRKDLFLDSNEIFDWVSLNIKE